MMGARSMSLAMAVVLKMTTVVTAVSFVSTGSTVMLNDISYYIPASSIATIQIRSNQLSSFSSALGLVPLTVFSTSSLTFNQGDLEVIIGNYTAIDDVFQAGFLESMLRQFPLFLFGSCRRTSRLNHDNTFYMYAL